MNRFEDLVHTARREEGELSVDRFNELWAKTQEQLFGDAVEVTDGYRSWWSYVPHFIASPGYVYAYAYGQLLALSVYARYQEEGPGFAAPTWSCSARAGRTRPRSSADRRLRPHRPWLLGHGPGPRRTPARAAEDAAREAGRL